MLAATATGVEWLRSERWFASVGVSEASISRFEGVESICHLRRIGRETETGTTGKEQ